jgi:Protein of unknown function (DUF3285)
MSQDAITSDPAEPITIDSIVDNLVETTAEAGIAPPEGSYVKHAMRNMVRKRSKSLQHFFLSAVGLLSLFTALAYLTK